MVDAAFDELTEPLVIGVYDKNLGPLFPLPLRGGVSTYDGGSERTSGLLEVRLSLGVNAVSVASIKMPLSHDRADDMQQPGVRVRISSPVAGHLLSGRVSDFTADRGEDAWGGSVVTFTVQDDFSVLGCLGWVAPGKGIDQQQSDNQDAYYRLSNSTAEYVVKRVVTDNLVNRWGMPLVVVPNQSRGALVNFTSRNHELASRLFPLVTQAGLGVRVRQEDDGSPAKQKVTVDVWEFPTHKTVLTPESPQVTDWSFGSTGPEAVRGVVGGQGQGTARVFRSAVSSEAATYGPFWPGEFFEDQRQESLASSLDAALQSTLTEKASKSHVDLTLQGTDRWSYGSAWRVGDFIRWQAKYGAPILTTQITNAELTWTPENGYQETSGTGAVGKHKLARTLALMTQRIQDLRASQ